MSNHLYPIKPKGFIALMTAILLSMVSCGSTSSKAEEKLESSDKETTMTEQTSANLEDTTSVKVKMTTSMGDITLLLYGDTPKHRDNFVKLVNEGYYNNVLFHRVISDFMIQTGDPDSKNATAGQRLGSGGPGYTLEAEIVFPRHFHKRGALAAARQGDQVNPERRSSGSQFYIVTGRKMIPAQLQQLKGQLKNQQLQATFNKLASEHMAEIRSMQAANDTTGLRKLQETLVAETEALVAQNPVNMTPEMETAYTQVGGAPHLDGQYTVFGEIIDGMNVVDLIEKAETDAADRPKEDIRIISTQILK